MLVYKSEKKDFSRCFILGLSMLFDNKYICLVFVWNVISHFVWEDNITRQATHV